MGAIALSYPLFFLMIYFEEMQLHPNCKPNPYPKGGMKVQQWQLILKIKCKSINFALFSIVDLPLPPYAASQPSPPPENWSGHTSLQPRNTPSGKF